MTSSNPMVDGRRTDSARRRQRVIKAINDASTKGAEISVSAIARAGVDRTFLYRHDDLLGQVHAAQANPAAAENGGPTVSRASLHADLANAHGQITRQAAHIRQLEKKALRTARRASLARVRPRRTRRHRPAPSPDHRPRAPDCRPDQAA